MIRLVKERILMKRLARRLITYLEADPPGSPCHHLWRGVSIRQNGDAEPCSCANVSEVQVGNVAEHGVLPILDSAQYRASRRFLRQLELAGDVPGVDQDVFGPCRACPVKNHRVLPLEDFRPVFDRLFRAPEARRRPLGKRLKKYLNFCLSNLNHRLLGERVRTYPLKATIDVSNVCNLRCPICQVGSGTLPHPRGLMQYEAFAAVLEEIGDYLFEIEYYRYGEPLTNRALPAMVALAQSYGIRSKISTNLLLLTPKMARDLVEAGLDIVVACADGTDQDVYVQYRRRGHFEQFLEKLHLLLDLKRELGSERPRVLWQFLVFKHNEHQLPEARAMAAELGVELVEAPAYYSGTADPDEWQPERDRKRQSAEKKAEIAVLEAPESVGMSQDFELRLRVTNLVEGRTWRAEDHTLAVGAKIYDAERRFLTEFGRAPLPCDIAPGASAELVMRLRAPRELGRYLVKLDMLRERGTWFEAGGAEPLWQQLEVHGLPLVRVLELQDTALAGAAFQARLEIVCIDNRPWPIEGKHPVFAGVKLYRADGTFVMDFGRGVLSHEMQPGETERVTMPLTAPEREGDYVLEFDMVKEFEYWFEQRGAVPVRLPLRVLAAVAVG
jgi:MoaA/NifB/PqqE/SkfB family radical SAM enzyme